MKNANLALFGFLALALTMTAQARADEGADSKVALLKSSERKGVVVIRISGPAAEQLYKGLKVAEKTEISGPHNQVYVKSARGIECTLYAHQSSPVFNKETGETPPPAWQNYDCDILVNKNGVTK